MVDTLDITERSPPAPAPDETARGHFDLDEVAPTMSKLYGVEQLSRDRQRMLLSLEQLPSWPAGPTEAGHGWGRHLDQILGGGIHPGYLLAVSAAPTNPARTAWMMQLVDGLALRTTTLLNEYGHGPLTPVLLVSDTGPDQLTWHSIARWTGTDARILRAGGSAEHLDVVKQISRDQRAEPGAVVLRAFELAKRALFGALGEARLFVRHCQPRRTGSSLLARINRMIGAWRIELSDKHGREVWPVVVIDPLPRWQTKGRGEAEALNELSEQLARLARSQGWIVLMTTEPHTVYADGEDRAAGERFKLLQLVDAALHLRRERPADRELEAAILANRWGPVQAPFPRFRWSVSTSRFVALPAPG